MEQKTTGTVISVKKQWWLKVNTKPVRMHALDGATLPHIITVKYFGIRKEKVDQGLRYASGFRFESDRDV